MGSHLNERSPANKPLPNLVPMHSPEDWLEGGNLAFQKKCYHDGQDRQESYQKGSSTKNVIRSGGKRNEQLEKKMYDIKYYMDSYLKLSKQPRNDNAI